MDSYVIKPTSEDLQHHGILGMKWGVRRYQNEDGTYTRAGIAKGKHAKEAKELRAYYAH